MKNYIAHADTGRDYIDFEFTSNARANSKQNHADAVKEYKKKHGIKRNIKILNTYLLNY